MSEEKKVIKAIKKAIPSVVSIVSDFAFNKKEKIFDIFHSGSDQEKMKIIGGSGFAVEKNLIVTSFHVIEGKENYYILDFKKKKSEAKIVHLDKANDTAFLKIKTNHLEPIKLGDSNKIQIGQTVIAIGTALGIFPNTVSKGIVSGISRTIIAQGEHQEDKELFGLIQTDAAINPGNSGGPLINTKGEVVGINTATVFGVENIGFALPINAIKEEINEIVNLGFYKKINLGIQYIILNKKISEILSLTNNQGALIVKEPLKDSPAQNAGLKKGDLILEINNEKISSRKTIRQIIRQKNTKEFKFKILRKGIFKNIILKINQ